EHVAARRLGYDHVVAVTHGARQHVAVGPRLLAEALEITDVQPGCAAADLPVGQRALDAVVLVDLHEVAADRGALVLDQARGEQRDAALALREPEAGPLLEPRREALLRVWREHALAGDADGALHQLSGERAGPARRLVHESRRPGGELAEEVGAPEELVGRDRS